MNDVENFEAVRHATVTAGAEHSQLLRSDSHPTFGGEISQRFQTNAPVKVGVQLPSFPVVQVRTYMGLLCTESAGIFGVEGTNGDSWALDGCVYEIFAPLYLESTHNLLYAPASNQFL